MPDSDAAPQSATGPQPRYDAHYFKEYWGGGGPYERNERWLSFFDQVAEGIVRDLNPSSVLDAGCAMGFLVEALRKRGVEAYGIDISEYAISQVDESVAEFCTVGSVTEPLARKYDLITCIEVVEHLPPEQAQPAVANLCQASDRVLLSSTPQDYGEPTHLNVQPPENWTAAFAGEGFLRDLSRDLSYISPWATLYSPAEEPMVETVRRYDRSWWRLRSENMEIRESLLGLQRKLEQATGGDQSGERPQVRQERERQAEEILRLRDLLIEQETELGQLRGRAAEAEEQSLRMTNVLRRLQHRMPGFAWALLARLLASRQG